MLKSDTCIWSEPEREAWRLPERITVSQWADAYRVLDSRTSAEPGTWATSRTPYLREIMDAFTDPWVEEITVMASTQVGKTEFELNCLGFAIDQDPGPTLIVYPREGDAKTVSVNRIKPMLEVSPALAAHLPTLSDDMSAMEYRLDRMTVYLAGANSPAALSSKPVRYLLLDEVDKYPAFSGREADPIKLAMERIRTYRANGTARVLKVSSPTTRQGYIFREYEASDRRRYHVPCPKCGVFQPLVFGQIRWPEGASAEEIASGRLAWYECPHCGGRIEDRDKGRVLSRGVWAPEGATVAPDGTVYGGEERPRHRGYWLSALYSPWLTFGEIAGEFLRSKDYQELLMNFVNSWLAEIWEEKTRERKPEKLKGMALDYPEGLVPDGALLLTAGVDVQERGFYLVIRGWGYHEESWLIRAAYLETWDDVWTALAMTHYPRAGGQALGVRLACIDSGYNAPDVYKFCRKRPDLLRPTKGHDHLPGAPIRAASIDHAFVNGKQIAVAGGLTLYHLDTCFLKDKLSRLMDANPEAPGGWHIHDGASDAYLSQMCSEQKIIERNRKTGVAVERWGLAPGHRANHLWDCEVYALAAAEMLRVGQMREATAASQVFRPAERVRPSAGSNWVNGGAGAWSGGRGGWMSRR